MNVKIKEFYKKKENLFSTIFVFVGVLLCLPILRTLPTGSFFIIMGSGVLGRGIGMKIDKRKEEKLSREKDFEK